MFLQYSAVQYQRSLYDTSISRLRVSNLLINKFLNGYKHYRQIALLMHIPLSKIWCYIARFGRVITQQVHVCYPYVKFSFLQSFVIPSE